MRRGFTLIELLVVLAIIAVMVSIALASVTGGREAAHVRDASRAVLQMSRYASSLALLRQRPVVVTYRKHRVDVQISGDSVTEEDVGSPAAPIYMEVDGEEIDQTPLMLEDEEERDETGAVVVTNPKFKAGGDSATEKTALFVTRSILDPEELAKEDAFREFEDVWFAVEVLGEDGKPLELDQAITASLPQPRPPTLTNGDDEDDEDDRRGKSAKDEEDDIPVSITYEPNGNCTPYRVVVRSVGDSEDSDGAVVSVSRSGKPQIDEEDEWNRRHRR